MYFRVILSAICLFISVNFASAAPFAYIANSGDDTLSVIDLETNGYIKKIPLNIPEGSGKMPYGVAVSKDGSRVYVTNQTSNTVSVIDAITDPLNPTVFCTLNHASLSTPSGIAVNPAGTRLYVANIGTGTVSVFDTTNKIIPPTFITSVGVGTAPEGVAVHPDGTFVYVANSGSNNVSVIDTGTNLLANVNRPVGQNPMGLAIKISGQFVHLYVANKTSGTVSVINPHNGSTFSTVTVGSNPFGVVLSPAPDYSYAYVTCPGYGSESISVIRTSDRVVTANIPLGTALSPMGISVSPDGVRIFTANMLGSSASILNTATNAVTSLDNIPNDPNFESFFSSPLSLGNFIGPPLYTITSSTGSDGKITLQGSTTPVTSMTVASGSSVTYSILPDTNYRINNVYVDGSSVMADPGLIFQGLNASWTFSNITNPHDIQATFIKNYDFISVLKSGTANGTVTSDVGGINCGAACYVSVTKGTVVTLTATPEAGKYFAGWVNSTTNPYDDVCSGANVNGNTCTFTMSTYVQPTASFSDVAPYDKVWKVSPAPGAYYSTLQTCFNSLTAGASLVETTTDVFTTETINLNMAGAVVTLRGGYTDKTTYATQGAAPSLFVGTITITNGTLIADNIAIK